MYPDPMMCVNECSAVVVNMALDPHSPSPFAAVLVYVQPDLCFFL